MLGGVVSALNVLCSKGDNVLLHSPTYIGFTGALTNNGYNIVHSDLVKDEAGIFRMDFEDMEKKVTEKKIHVMIFCSPHNPVGRVWERSELEELSEFCEKHDITVIADEIWSDIILSGYKHIPVQSATEYLHENTAAMYAPSKTFNLAGLVGSYHIIYNKRLRERIVKESSLSDYNNMNVLSMHALIGAYSQGGMDWVDEMRSVINDNVELGTRFFEGVPGATLSRPQGTYMLFPDFTDWCEEKGMTMDELEQACWKVGVALQDGRMFHGEHSLRINLALPTSYVKEAFDRLGKYVFK